jgi:hypothetical protein
VPGLLIRIGEAVDGAFPIDVYRGDGAPATWPDEPSASGRIEAGSLGGPYPDLSDEAVTRDELAAAGTDLFAGLAVDDIGATLAAELACADRLLLDVRPTELRDLPWELLRDADQRWIFSSPDPPAAMRVRSPFAAEPPALRFPIKVLAVVGDPDDGTLRAADEVDGIYGGIRCAPACWHVDALYGPGMEELARKFVEIQPDVLHFIGHGRPRGPDGEPALEVISADGPWELTAEFIMNALRGAAMPRLVVLNACRTSALGPANARATLWGVTDAFLAAGTSAVISMQGDLASAAAVRFSTELYRRLAAGDRLDLAVAAARHGLQWSQNFQPRDWTLPVLTARACPENILRCAPHTAPDRLRADWATEYDDLRWLVDRSEERRRLLGRVSADAALVFVSGTGEVGKSRIARACAVAANLHGVAAAYVQLPERNLGWQDFLGYVVDETAAWLGARAAGPADRYRDAIGPLLVEMLGGRADRVTEMPFVGARPRRTGDYVDAAFLQFRDFLAAVATGEPLVLILDRIGRVFEPDKLIRYLFEPAARREFDGVRLIVVDRDSELDRVVPSSLRRHDDLIEIKPFRQPEIVRLAREYCIRRRDAYRAHEDDRPNWDRFVARVIDEAERRTGDPDTLRDVFPIELTSWETSARYAVGIR